MSDARLLQALLHDGTVAAMLADDALCSAMVEVEAALARVQAELGVIPVEAGRDIVRSLADFRVDKAELMAGMRADGVPVPVLVQALRRHVGGQSAAFVHHGATSQDILDTAMILGLDKVLRHLDQRLDVLVASLRGLAIAHRETAMVARTRWQQALPTVYGLKVLGWAVPHAFHRRRLAELSPRLLRVQLYGAAGTLAGMGDKGLAVTEALARELGLGFVPYPWHAMRDAVLELGSWLSLVSGSLGKFGQDLLLLAQSEVGEVREAVGGRSSAMPHKSNPVRCEALVTVARANAGSLSGLHQAAIQEHERGGAGWQLEWQLWPDMAIRTAAAIEHAIQLADTLVIDTERMKQALEGRSGLLAQADIANPQAHFECARQIFDATLETLEDTDRSDHNLS